MIGTRSGGMFAPPPNYNTPPIYDPRDSGAVSAQDPTLVAPAIAQGGSIWDRIGAALKQPGVSGALLRSAGATLDGGLGAGIKAATGYMDDQHAIAARAQQQGFLNHMEVLKQNVNQQQADQTGRHFEAGDYNQALTVEEAIKHNRNTEALGANGQRVQLYGIDTGAATARRGQDVQLTTNAQDNATSRANNQASVGANIYGTNVAYLGDGLRAQAAGIGSKANGAYTETKTKTKAVNPWFGEGTPGSETTTHIPLAVSSPTSPPAPAAIAALKSNPGLAAQFEVKYGTGTAAQYLGGR